MSDAMKQFPDSPAPAPSSESSDSAKTRVWPPISVVIPVLNEERHLREAVHQVLSQHYEGPIEVVLAIGPSQDRTQEVADAIAAEDPG
nr:hypothetical protein GCM10020093_092320 [Planobispora longispora]